MKRIISTGNKFMAGFIILLTVCAVFIPIFEFTEKFQDYLVHFLIFLIFSGLIGLILSNKTILYTSFGCAAALAFFLKNASNPELKNPTTNGRNKLTVVHINLSLITDVETVRNIISDESIQVISFQEYTPDWASIIPEITKAKFPYIYQDVRIDLYGKAIFSKNIIRKSEVINYTDIPNIETQIESGDDVFTILSSYMTPALDNMSKTQAKSQFRFLEEYSLKNKDGKIIMGEFNQVYWSHDILSFRNKTGLLNSRRNVFPTTMKMPYDHIFYSPDLECFYFEELNDSDGNHFGCKSSFQFKNQKSR